MLSPSLCRITNRMRASITELSFHGIPLPAPFQGKKCNPCLRYVLLPMSRAGHRVRIPIIAGTVFVAVAAAGQTLASFNEVRPVLEAMQDRLPPGLAVLNEGAWNSWSRVQSAEIRSRLEQG